MNSRSGVEVSRSHIIQLSVGCPMYYHLSPTFRRSQLDPISIGPIKHYLTQTDRFFYDQFRSDGRFPGTVRRNFGLDHWTVRRIICAKLRIRANSRLSSECGKVQAAKLSNLFSDCLQCRQIDEEQKEKGAGLPHLSGAFAFSLSSHKENSM